MSTTVAGVSIFKRYAAVLGSLALHGAAIAWVQARPAPAAEAPAHPIQAPIEILTVAPAEPEPMVVALLPDHSVVAPTPGTVATIATSAKPPRTRGLGPKVEAPGAVTLAPSGEPARTPRMTMRRPEPPTLDPSGLSGDFTEAFLRNSRPIRPNDNPSEELHEQLTAAEANLANPRWIANASADQVTAARMQVAALRAEYNQRELQPDGAGRKAEHKTFRVKVAADGSAKIHDKANLQRKGLLGATFDVTDGLMRAKGIDPYSSYKLKVLDETREERVAMGKRHRTRELAQVSAHVQRNLDRLWATTADVAARKRGLFELWDDCAETGTDEVVVAGTAARRYIIGFIRSKLPATSPDAFTAEELRRLNRQRKSQLPFAPYP